MLSFGESNFFRVLHAAQTIYKMRRKKVYYKEFLTFDIETTNIGESDAVMYIWQMCITDGNEIAAMSGRTWEKFNEVITAINGFCGDNRIVCYIHNLSFEFQFFSGVIPVEDVFCVKSRRPLCCRSGSIEFRCSYLWTNKNLANFLKDEGAEHAKLSGADFDYSLKRYPWTKLSYNELQYCYHDVIGLAEAINTKLTNDNDTVVSTPLTATGFVRRDAKRALKNKYLFIRGLIPDEDTYNNLRAAFRGGNTHANRFYAGRILENVCSCDRSSSYPDVMINCKFPMTAFNKAPDGNKWVKRFLGADYAILTKMMLYNIRLKNPKWGCPYIPISKCIAAERPVIDNGRVLSADLIVLYATDVDINIILEEYTGRVIFSDTRVSQKDYLPDELRELVRKYYRGKTSLKDVEGQEREYRRSKELLNSIYGMCATDPCKPDIIYEDDDYTLEYCDYSGEDGKGKKAFLPYQWGVWVTAYARFELEQMIKAAGESFVYADTDSCKYVQDSAVSFDIYNNERLQRSEKNGAFADDKKGSRHYMGVAESEGTVKRFLTWGAKKYAYEDENGKLKITIAGVRKSDAVNDKGEIIEKGGATELKEAGGLEALKIGYTFREAGGLESIYNDKSNYDINVDGHTLHVGKNVSLRQSTYTLSITDEYADILNACITLDADRAICYDIHRRQKPSRTKIKEKTEHEE